MTGRAPRESSPKSTSATAIQPAGRLKGYGPLCPNLEPTPTAAELAAGGLATERVDRNGQRYYAISAEGQKILSDVMRRNGQRSKAWRESQHDSAAGDG